MFKVGEKVWTIDNGWGAVERIYPNSLYPVLVRFKKDTFAYTADGKESIYKNRALFFEEIPIPESALTRSKWRAEKGESYYTITAFGDVDGRVENFDEYDNNLFRAKNYFRTAEEAKESKIYRAFHEEVKNDKV